VIRFVRDAVTRAGELAFTGTQLVAVLVVAGLVTLFVTGLLQGILANRRLRKAPLTGRDEFRAPAINAQADSQFGNQNTAAVRPRLSPLGHVAFVFLVVFGALGAGITLATLHKFAVDRRFDQTGQVITANVINASQSVRSRAVQYDFEVDGRKYFGFGDVRSLRSRIDAQKTRQLAVRYLPSDPSTNRPAEEPSIPIWIGLLIPAAIDLAVIWLAWHLRRDFVLAKTGRHARGIVIGTVPQPHFGRFVYYDFLDERGEVLRGTASLSLPYSMQVSPGSPVEVLYQADRPQRNTLKHSMCWRTADAA
jgi:hypothetical protein